jgi:hypothetical protein
MYDGEGSGKHITAFEGKSKTSIDDAIRAAVHASDVPSGTKLVITYIEVETVDDPNVGSYKVILGPSS